MQLTIRNARATDINAIVELQGKLADHHRKLDKYFKAGKEMGK